MEKYIKQELKIARKINHHEMVKINLCKLNK